MTFAALRKRRQKQRRTSTSCLSLPASLTLKGALGIATRSKKTEKTRERVVVRNML